jgi:DNA adenine methylase
VKYLGGTGRIAKRLVQTMLDLTPATTDRWVEPFVGGAWVLDHAHASGRFRRLHAGDAVEDLILLYRAVGEGWEPPREMSREEYAALKAASPSPLRALAGFGSAYGGNFFTGYCGDQINHKSSRTNSQIAADHMARRAPMLADVDLRHTDYRGWSDLVGPDTVLYCDPPYAGTTTYTAAEPFDGGAFWLWVLDMADRGAHVFVSEYEGPTWADEVWSREGSQNIAPSARQKTVTERLFHVPPGFDIAERIL